MDDAQCEDNNPCTSEWCEFNECYFWPEYLTPCDDGLFCNGDDRCHYGDCSEHTGDPCPPDTICNEDTDSCDPFSGTSTTTTSNQGSSTTTTTPAGGSLSISGYVTGAVIEEVSVKLAGTASETSITAADGSFEFLNLGSGFYTLRPEKVGYSFEPPNYVIPNLTSDLLDMNFEATKTRCLVQSIYGEHSTETKLLRSIRDNVLSKTPEGRELIKLYYQWSPVIMKAMEADEDFKEGVKEMVDGVLGTVK
jgi:hypothetical protein